MAGKLFYATSQYIFFEIFIDNHIPSYFMGFLNFDL